MKINPISRRLVAILVALVSSTLARAQTASLETSSAFYSPAGDSATFDLSFDYTGKSLSTMGVDIALPSGWSFASASGSNVPPIGPKPGTTVSAEFAYFSVPSNSISFSVTLNYTSGLTGEQEIEGKILYKVSGNSTSLEAALGPVAIAAATLPAFNTQPESINVNEGTSANFSATVTGAPTPTLHWQKNGSDISGATSSTFAISPVSAADAGAYSLVATNDLGSATSSTAELTVNVAPSITTQPVAKTVTAGGNITFSVTAIGTGPLLYQWRKGGVDVPDQTSVTLSLTNVQTTDAGSYDVVISNMVGPTTSAAASLTVQVPVTISTQPLSQTVVASTSVSFSVVATGDPTPTYQWRKDGSTLAGQTSSTLDLSNVDLVDAGNYDVEVTNAVGSLTSNSATLTVQVPVTITTQPQSQTLATGDTLNLSVGADGNPAPTFQWRKDGNAISGATTASYSKPDLIEADAGSYDVVVSNVVGDVTSAASTIIIQSFPVITGQPQSGVFLAGGGVDLAVQAGGADPLSYQWRKAGSDVAGATSSTLSFASLTLDNVGNYDVVVTNPAGSVTSQEAALTVVELTGTHTYGGKGYRPGKVLTINNTITYSGDLASFGWSVIPPDAVSGQKWTFDGSGGSAGEVVPLSGDTDLFEWDWTSTPASPIEFSYTLNVPSNVNGDQNLAGVLRARASGTELDTMVNPDPLTVPVAPATHDADFDQDNKFSLSELLRVIELYNTREGTKRTGTYHPDGTSVDGFAPGPEPEE